MADTDTTAAAAPKAKRKAQGPKQMKPVFLVITYKDEQGNAVKLDKSRLSVEPTKDASAVVEMVTSGDTIATVVTIRVPSEARATPAAG